MTSIKSVIKVSIMALALFIQADILANDGIFPPAPAARPYINFDGRGFIINGQRTFIASGSFHYPRAPRAQWRDILLQMKRAGLNTVETYAFWNYHEEREDVWDFSGERDFGAFLQLAHEVGLYVIVRVGPYVCAEWDSGGYPVWLAFKPGMIVRTNNKPFLAESDKWFDKIIPIVAANQINHGGSVILVQLENEHPLGWGTDTNQYFQHLSDKALSLGLEVPYFFSGLHHSADPAGDQPWDNNARANPWFTTEYYPGWYDLYGPVKDPVWRGRTTWKTLAYGANGYNYYMFFGGSNFDHWNIDRVAASYDYGAPIGQAGDLRPTYYRFKKAAIFGTTFSSIFADGVNATASYQNRPTNPKIHVAARGSQAGTVIFLDNPSGTNSATTQVKDATGRIYPNAGALQLDPYELMPVVINYSIAPRIKIDFSAARIVGYSRNGNETTLVICGHLGEPGEVTFSGGSLITSGSNAWQSESGGRKTLHITFANGAPVEYTLNSGKQKLRILTVSLGLADRTWFVRSGNDNLIVCGPEYVGDVLQSGRHLTLNTSRPLDADANQVFVYGPGGLQTAWEPAASGTADAPVLSAWKEHILAETLPGFDDSSWKSFPKPELMGADGDGSAYAWYRTTLRVTNGGTYNLLLGCGQDRLIPCLDGKRVDKLQNNTGALRLNLAAGTHSLDILALHRGRDVYFPYIGPLLTRSPKGIDGIVYFLPFDTGGVISLNGWQGMTATNHQPIPAYNDPRWSAVSIGDVFHGTPGFYWYQTVLPDTTLDNHTATIAFSCVDDNATVYLNGEQIGQHQGWGSGFEIKLSNRLHQSRTNMLSVLVQNIEGAGGITAPVMFCPRIDQVATWTDWKMKGGLPNPASIKRWNLSGTAPSGQLRFYQATFQYYPSSTNNVHPIYRVLTDSLSAGCVYVNGHNLGHYPEKIPVKGIYIPESWLLKGENTLTIFDENAMSPARVSIAVENVASRHDTQIYIPLEILVNGAGNHNIVAMNCAKYDIPKTNGNAAPIDRIQE